MALQPWEIVLSLSKKCAAVLGGIQGCCWVADDAGDAAVNGDGRMMMMTMAMVAVAVVMVMIDDDDI
jgi:hypothetical protein